MNPMRKPVWLFAAAALVLAGMGYPVVAAIHYVDLGTVAPPASVGPVSVVAFDQAPQAAIPNLSNVNTIPGSPQPGNLTTLALVNKRTIGFGWATWSHGYVGPVFFSELNFLSLNLPQNAAAFYLYMESNSFGQHIFNVTANGNVSSGPVGVDGNAGARGFGFYCDAAGEVITNLTITADEGASGFCIGEFGISVGKVFTNVSKSISMVFTSWTLSRQTGTLFGTLKMSNSSAAVLSAPFWYAMKGTSSCRLMRPTGSLPGGYQYVDISRQMATALARVGNRDQNLNPGETVTVSGIEVYSRTRQIPPGLLYAIWADPPAYDADGDGTLSDGEVLRAVDDWSSGAAGDTGLFNAIGLWKVGAGQ